MGQPRAWMITDLMCRGVPLIFALSAGKSRDGQAVIGTFLPNILSNNIIHGFSQPANRRCNVNGL